MALINFKITNQFSTQMEGVQNNQGNDDTRVMNVKNFAAKFATKGEIYRFLTVEAKVYLPDYRTVTIWHMKDLASGEKKVGTPSLFNTLLANL